MVSQFLYRRIRTNGNTCGSALLYHLTPVQRAVDKHGRDKNNHQTRLRNAGGIAWISIPIHSSKGHVNALQAEPTCRRWATALFLCKQ